MNRVAATATALAAALLLTAAGTAAADDIDQAAAALRSSPVYQAPGLDLVDVATLSSELAGKDPRVDVAVLPGAVADNDGQARQRAIDIGRQLGDSDAVVLVITANGHSGAGEGHAAAARGVNAERARIAERASIPGTSKDSLTAFVTGFAERVQDQASRPSTAAPSRSTSGGSSHLVLWLVLLAIVGGGVALLVRSSRQRTRRLNEGLRAEVEQLYERLGADVLNLDAGRNEQAKQALADAAERYSACGSQLAEADGPAEFAAARRTAVEGLTAARKARESLGMDPGPPIPLVPGDGPQLEAEHQVTIDGQTYDGSPDYQPGRKHYFGGGMIGGQQVPGGWYSGNFWEPFLLGSILTGGFGGGFGGGIGGSGYDQGHDAGRQDASGGGDWGGGGGGDWGGGGGGGGDW